MPPCEQGAPERCTERGHIELGMTLSIFGVIALLAFLELRSEEGAWALFLSWPLWGKAGALAGIAALLLGGHLLEAGRRWPAASLGASPGSDEDEEGG